MGREKLEESGPPGSSARLRAGLVAADRFISVVTWGVAAGMIVWSMLNATPYVADHLAPEWRKTAFVLPLVVDLAFLGSLRADEIASRHNVSGGVWAGLLRLFTGAGSVFLNIGHAAEKGDWTGVFQHLITPGILVLLAEAGPVYRRRLARRLDEVELEEAAKAEKARKEQREEADRRRRQAQEDADRQEKREREEEDRRRQQRLEEEDRAAEREERRETGRATRELESKRLDLEAQRLATRPAPAPAAPVRVPVAPVAPTTAAGIAAPAPRSQGITAPAVARQADPGATGTDRASHSAPEPQQAARQAQRPAVEHAAATQPSVAPARPATPIPSPAQERKPAPVAAAQTSASARVTSRIEADPEPAPPAGPVKDWQLPGLPADCAPGRAPELLTDAQVTARMNYGLDQEWTQRRIGEFAGRSATVVNRHKQKREKAA
ncbi:hypothetical protein AB0M05_47260 [Streptomyces violaceusniger]|uniref:hypothetical protein n=1 Tax=Streptomyces violaceusniger TaxID=68280 RepID=UPI00343B3B6D